MSVWEEAGEENKCCQILVSVLTTLPLPLLPDAEMCKDAQMEKEEELKKALSGCDRDLRCTMYKDVNSLSAMVGP